MTGKFDSSNERKSQQEKESAVEIGEEFTTATLRDLCDYPKGFFYISIVINYDMTNGPTIRWKDMTPYKDARTQLNNKETKCESDFTLN